MHAARTKNDTALRTRRFMDIASFYFPMSFGISSTSASIATRVFDGR